MRESSTFALRYGILAATCLRLAKSARGCTRCTEVASWCACVPQRICRGGGEVEAALRWLHRGRRHVNKRGGESKCHLCCGSACGCGRQAPTAPGSLPPSRSSPSTTLLIHTPWLEAASARYLPAAFVSTADHMEHHRRLTTRHPPSRSIGCSLPSRGRPTIGTRTRNASTEKGNFYRHT